MSYQRALWGRYQLLELRERVRPDASPAGDIVGVTSSTALPPVDVVDMREELKAGNRSIFSRPLQLGLYQALEQGRAGDPLPQPPRHAPASCSAATAASCRSAPPAPSP